MNTNLEANASDAIDETTPEQREALAALPESILPTAELQLPTATSLITYLPPEIERQVHDLIKATKVGETQGLAVLEKFAVGFEPFLRLKAEAEAIVVTDASQKDLIDRAWQIDKELLEADKTLTEIHKEQKEFYLRPGQMVDGCRRIPSNAIAAVRAHLKQQFDFVRNAEAARLKQIEDGRKAQLAEFGSEGFVPNLDKMDDETFALVLAGAKAKFEEDQRSAANAQIENERLRKENERLAAENAIKRAAEDRRIARVNRLSAIGMTFDGTNYSYEELNFSNYNLDTEDDAAFEADFAVVAPEVKRRVEAKAEKARVDAETARIAQEQINKLNAEKAEKARLEREAALAPDKEKLAALGAKIAALEMPTVDAQFEPLLRDVTTHLQAAAGMLASFAAVAEVSPVRASDEPCPF